MMRRSVLLLAVALLFPFAARAADRPPPQGVICIAPFHAEPGSPGLTEPNMSQTTWGPSLDSIFEFRIDGKLRATVGNGQMAMISGLPLDRRIKIQVLHDQRPFETVSLDFRSQPEPRICLWLYPSYWHWINNTWIEKLGCRCKPVGQRP
ncbi:MAG: hypothetical protein ABI609_09215 [Acidobacteriota bacterium]